MAEVPNSGCTVRQAVLVLRNNTQEKEAIQRSPSFSESSAGPKRIQLWRSKVITVIQVCAVNSPGSSHAEASEMLAFQGDALANTGALLSEPACPCPHGATSS